MGKEGEIMVIENRVMFKVMFSAAALMHICFLLMFYNAGTMPLVIFNILSVVLYIGGVVLTFTSSKIDKHILGMTVTVYAEVSAHAFLTTLLLGFEPCFLLYSTSILPMCAFTLFSVEKKKFIRTTTIMCFINTVLIIVTLAIVNKYNALSSYPLTFDEIKIMRLINVIFNLALVFGFSFLFINQINSLLKKLSDTNDQLVYMASHDALTGLVNRRSLWDFLYSLQGSGSEFCICMGDIDNFKRTNDTFGHDCGDQVLKQVAEVIRNNIGESDIACRWGGEEILIIMISSRSENFERVSKMRRQISELDIWHEGKPVPTTMTFGFADSSECQNQNEIDLEGLISLVDKRLYDGKKSGKNVVISK